MIIGNNVFDIQYIRIAKCMGCQKKDYEWPNVRVLFRPGCETESTATCATCQSSPSGLPRSTSTAGFTDRLQVPLKIVYSE